MNFTTAGATLTAAQTVTVTDHTLTLGGGVNGAYPLTKAGNGTLVLGGAGTGTVSPPSPAGLLKCSGNPWILPSPQLAPGRSGSGLFCHEMAVQYMQTIKIHRFPSIRAALVLMTLAPLAPLAQAQHHSLNVPSGSDCTIREYRKQTLTPNIYDALYMSWSVTGPKSNITSGWYGGAIHNPTHSRVFYSFWPSATSYPAGAVQKFIFAGEANSNAEWHVSIGEGTIGGVSAEYPIFQTNQWYRFATRYWQPADATAHVGFQGN